MNGFAQKFCRPSLVVMACLSFSSIGARDLDVSSWTGMRWSDGEEVALEKVEFKGFEAFEIPAQSLALLEGEEVGDFVFELDIASEMMPGVAFRSDENLNTYEYVYFRVYGGVENREKIQYLPTYNGEMSWQLYNYPIYEKPASTSAGDWFHAKFVVSERKVALYLNNEDEASMVIDKFETERTSGKLFLTSISQSFYVKNATIRNIYPSDEIPDVIVKNQIPEGTIMQWKLSDQFECENSSFIYQRVVDLLEAGEVYQRTIEANRNGLVNLSQHFEFPRGWALVETEIESKKAGLKTLEFDYTHEMAIFLNGLPIFCGKEIDRANHNFGRVIAGEERIDLNLEKGTNVITFAIRSDEEVAEYFNSERFGRIQSRNWGFTARIVE